MRGVQRRRWTALGLGLALMAGAVVLLDQASSSAAGVVTRSRARGIESDACFYSEVDDVRAFLGEGGRYRAPRSIRREEEEDPESADR